MLTYDFENVKIPLYEYIYKCIKNDIITGIIKPKAKLPSKRTFAKNNGVSTITIQNAYDQLISEGYVITIPKKGYYVAEISEMNIVRNKSKNSNCINVQEADSKYIDLSGNQINPKNFPFSVWAKLVRRTITEKSIELMTPSLTGGTSELRKAIAEHLHSFRGIDVDYNQIIIGAGTEYLYSLIIQLLGDDSVYCIENPSYFKIAKIYASNKVKYRYSNMDERGIIVPEIEKNGAEIIHISPTHHFPTGITMPVSRRYEILAWVNGEDGRYIIEDDYDSEFRLTGKPIPPMFSIDSSGKVIYMNTFSKSLLSTMRISYMVLPPKLANKFYEKLSFYSCTVSNFEQYTLAKFIDMGYFEKHINRMRLYYSRQRKKVLECIEKSVINDKCEVIENDSGLHFLIKLNTKLSDEEVIKALKRERIVMKAISEYYIDKIESKHIFILNYANIDIEKLREILKIINEII